MSFLLKEPRRVVAREKKERFFFYSGDATIARSRYVRVSARKEAWSRCRFLLCCRDNSISCWRCPFNSHSVMRVTKGVLGANDCGKVGIDIPKRAIIG